MVQQPFASVDDMDTPTTAAEIRALGLQPIPAEMLDEAPWSPEDVEEQEDGEVA